MERRGGECSVETLLDRGADDDLAEAEATVERLAAAPADDGLAMRDIWLLRLRALLARAHGDDTAYRNYRDRCRDMATSLVRGTYRLGRGDGMAVVADVGPMLLRAAVLPACLAHACDHRSP